MDKRLKILTELQELRIRKDELESSKNFLIEEFNSNYVIISLALTSPAGGYINKHIPTLTKENVINFISADLEDIEKQMEEKYKEMVVISNEYYHYGWKK
jgi:hypothetical protein